MADGGGPVTRGLTSAVIRDYEIVRVESDLDDPVLQVGSISKAVAALVALALVERGALDLDAEVNDRLTSWQAPAKVTLRQLLSHTGGVDVDWFPGHPYGSAARSLPEVLDGLAVDDAAQGTFRYSGGGYAIVQQLLEDVTGEAFADVAYELVLVPLGMHSSTFAQELPDRLLARAVDGHRGDERVEGGHHVYPAAAAAGLWTTARDLAAFVLGIQCALGGRVSPVSRRSAVSMLTPQAAVKPQEDFEAVRALGIAPPEEVGLGLFLAGDGTRFGHLGGSAGFAAVLDASVGDGSGAVVISNTEGDFERVLVALAAAV
jgi:CubicO group peptidase (beta-lactamase class C family)